MKHFQQFIHLYCTALALMLSAVVLAQQEKEQSTSPADEHQLSIGLNYLGHGEVRNGGLITPESTDETDKANFLLSRTRLSMDYKMKGIEARAVAQNTAVWGMSGSTAFNLYEAWVKLSTRIGFFAQLGRQALSYDDERIIGPNDWAMTSYSHDLLKLAYEGHGHKAHLLLAYNQNSENTDGGTYYKDGSQSYKTMHTLWYHYDVPKFPLGASLLFMNIGMQAGEKNGKDYNAPHTEFQQLVGSHVYFRPKHWSLEASYYKQMGQNENGLDIDAWMASVKGTLTPSEGFGFHAGFDYLSGDDYFAVPPKGALGLTRHEVIKGFNLIYGSHHKFYGAMDFFYITTYVNGFSPGLQNAFIGGYVKPIKNLKVGADYHYLAMAVTHQNMDMTLGHEIELEASYQFMKEAKLTAGFSYMTGTETMEKLKRASGDGSLRWGWVSLNINPSLFTTKW